MSKISTAMFTMLRAIVILTAIAAPAAATPELYLRAPSAEAPIIAGADCAIAWRATEYRGAVDIRLWDGERGVWSVIASGIAAERGSYTWSVPRDLAGDLFRIEVRGSAVPGLASRSGAFLSIREGRSPAIALARREEREGREPCIVRPNPCSLYAVIELGGRIPLGVDLVGIASGISYPRAVVAEAGGAQIATDDLPSGAYIVRVRCADGDAVLEKLLIQHTE